ARSSGRAAAQQRFAYLIVIDFEATCWRDARRRGPEIIEFPAVLLNASTGDIEDEFHTYVQPQEHPLLSDFCTELTGITQRQVDEGIPLNICLSRFLKWIQKVQKEKKIVFGLDTSSRGSEANPCTFVTWTDWDLGVCLQYECKRKQLRKPDILNSWIDLKATYRAFYNRKPQGLSGALQDLGIAFAGREHSGLDDSRNTARLAWRLICDGCVLKVTKSLDKVSNYLGSSLLLPLTPTINFSDKTPLGSNSRSEASRDRTRETNFLAEENQNITAGIKTNSHVQTEEQQASCIDSSAEICTVPSSSSRTELPAQAQSFSIASTEGFPLMQAQQPPSALSAGIQQGLLKGHPLGAARDNPPTCGSGLVLVSTTISSVTTSSEDISTTSDCLSLLADWEEVALIPESQCQHESECVQAKDDSSADLLTVFKEETASKQTLSSANQSTEKTTVPVEPHKSIVYKSPDTTIYNVGTVPRQTSNFSAFKLPSAKVNGISAQPALTGNHPTPLEAPKRKPTSPKPFPPAKKQPFAIYQEKSPSFSQSLPLRSSSLPKVSPAILNSTLNFNPSPRGVKNRNPTPPLCNCGRRAKKLYVSNTGPNHGRAFFCCPAGKQEANKKGCGYFKWEHVLLKEKINDFSSNAVALTSSNVGDSSNKKHFSLRPSMRT
ncbi:ERI2 exoribonuclease, partial [Heliornis fulica]|nr:ERI2 exoribonuclease [Heliornis fulica]